jgi:hypothetical protein
VINDCTILFSFILLHLDAAIFDQIMITLVQGAVDHQENQFQKSCFLVLKKLIELQGN